jgi:DNA polymerase V
MYALVDCNNFYASCERVFNPKVENVAVVVLSNNDGCVIARSNEAKLLGIKMGDPAFMIKDFLTKNNVAVFSTNFTLYGDMSERVMSTLKDFADEIEIYSIDEAFLDMHTFDQSTIYDYGITIRSTVKKWTGIPVSIGIARTKTLAKVANKVAKKNRQGPGVHLLDSPEKINDALADLDVEDIWGVGRQHGKFLKNLGINTALNLTMQSDAWIKKHMTIMGLRTVKELRGVSCIPMELISPDKKGILTSRSFGTAVTELDALREAIATFTASCAEKLRRQHSCAHCLMVFILTDRFKPSDPQYKSYKMVTLEVPSNNTLELVRYSLKALELVYRNGYKYKKAGVFVTEIVPDCQLQTSLFDTVDREKYMDAISAMDTVNGIMGRDKVRLAVQGFDRKWKLRQEKLSPCFTTNWRDLLTIQV